MSVDTDMNISPVLGTAGNDNLGGTGRSEVLSGAGGDDTLQALSGNDEVFGGSGNDTLYGQGGDDTLYGNGKPAYIDMSNFTIAEATTANVTFIDEGAGYRNALGVYEINEDGSFSNVQILFANASKEGSGGSLIPGESNVQFDVASGAQLGFFIVSNGYGKGYVNRGALDSENGIFEFRTPEGEPGTISSSSVELWLVDSANGQEIHVQSQFDYSTFHSHGSFGSDYSLNPDDYMHVVGRANTVEGQIMIGFEDIFGGGDNDYDDTVITVEVGRANVVSLLPQSTGGGNLPDDDMLYGGDGDDTLFGVSGDDYLSGGGGNDALNGNSGADELYGDDGNDVLTGNSGNDYLYGGSGDDELNGSSGDDILRGDSGEDLLNGNSGDDVLFGGGDADVLNGNSGEDVLYGGNGNDSLSGGSGVDYLYGQSGADNLSGGSGSDFLYGGNGNDELNGNSGNDYLSGDSGSDILNGHSGNDILIGANGQDELNGGSGNDVLDGGNHNDRLKGGSGEDQLFGGAGNDSLANRMLLTSMLKKLGASVSTASNGEEAIEVASRVNFDFIFMDIQMPVLDGCAAASQILENYPLWHPKSSQVQIFAVTTDDTASDREKYFDPGMCGLIAKPFAEENVRSSLLQHMPENQGLLSIPVWDLADFEEGLGITDLDLQKRLLTAFRSEMQERLMSLSVARPQQNVEEILKQLHGIKGSAATYRAQILSQAASETEKLFKGGQWQIAWQSLEKVERLAEHTLATMDRI
jgi:serralysin